MPLADDRVMVAMVGGVDISDIVFSVEPDDPGEDDKSISAMVMVTVH